MEPGPGGDVMENPSNADILHLEAAEADRLAGALMNDWKRTCYDKFNKFHKYLNQHVTLAQQLTKYLL